MKGLLKKSAYLIGLAAALPSGAAPYVIALDPNNGPTEERINFVWIAEGRTEAEMHEFITIAQAQWNELIETEPYREYRTFLNGFAIPVAWQHTPAGPSMTYADHDFMYQIVSNAVPEYSVVSLVFKPETGLDPGVALTDICYCGWGGLPHYAAAVHEISHAFADLGDEYACGGGEARPNLDQDLSTIKWSTWITPGTPIPTPDTNEYNDVVGAFEICPGTFRSKRFCLMRGDYYSHALCEVCREAVTLQFYRTKTRLGLGPGPDGRKSRASRIRPILSIDPPASGITLGNQQSRTFSVACRPFAGPHSMSYTWYLDGQPISGATGSSYVYQSDGTNHRLSIMVRDLTPFVRADLYNDLADSVFWTINESGVAIASPADNVNVRVGTVNLTASITPKAGPVSRVEWYAENTLLHETSTAPLYSFGWTLLREGIYTVRAKAISSLNGIESVAWSSPVRINLLGWQVINLGANLAADQGSEAFDLNDSGQVVGRVNTGTDPYNIARTAFRTAPYAPIDLTTDNLNPPGIGNTTAHAINNIGDAVGIIHSGYSDAPEDWFGQAFRALAGSTLLNIHPPGGPGYSFDYSAAKAINQARQVVGLVGHGYWMPFFIDPPGHPDPTEQYAPGSLRDVNDAGQAVGYVTYNGRRRAIRVPVGSTTIGTFLDSPSTRSSEAWRINASGRIAGQVESDASSGYFYSFVTDSSGMIDDESHLGDFALGRNVAYGLNDNGQAVGSLRTGTSERAFFWNGVRFDLNNIVRFASAWVFREARAINSHLDIAGSGTYGGLIQGFLLRALSSPRSPEIQITHPANGAIIDIPPPDPDATGPQQLATLVLGATTLVDDAAEAHVEFYLDGALVGSDWRWPFNKTVYNIAPGVHTVSAKAFNSAGQEATATPVTFTVDGHPQLAFTAPTPGATYPEGAPVRIAAVANDPGGAIARVEFREPEYPTVIDSDPPYEMFLDHAAILEVRAYDTRGKFVSKLSPSVARDQRTLLGGAFINGSTFQLTVRGPANGGYQIETAADPAGQWLPVSSGSLPASGIGSWSDSSIPSTVKSRYYRARISGYGSSYHYNSFGFIRVNLPASNGSWYNAGWILLANQLKNPGGNGLSVLFPLLDEGTLIYKWDSALFDYLTYYYVTDFPWIPEDGFLGPGEGCYMWNPSSTAQTLTFVGELPQGDFGTVLPGTYAQVSSKVPLAGGVQSVLGLPLANGDKVVKLVGSSQNWVQYTFNNNAWYIGETPTSEPTVQQGEAFWSIKANPATWRKTFFIPP